MNKKIIAVIALVLVLTIGLVACNGKTYKSSGVADGNKYASSPVENNGSFVVKQGGYVYFVNAYVGADAENKFGKQEKSCLYRAELDENGNIIEGSRVALVNKTFIRPARNPAFTSGATGFTLRPPTPTKPRAAKSIRHTLTFSA